MEIAVGHAHIDEPAPGRRAELECSRVTVHPTSAHDNVSAGVLRTLQADRVVSGADIAVFDEHVLTAVDIESIIVEVVIAESHGNRIEVNVLAVDQVQSPEGWTLIGDARKGEILTTLHTHQTWADARVFTTPPVPGKILVSSPAIDHAEPFDGDVFCVFSVDQAMGGALSRSAEVVSWVVSHIGASEQAGPVIEREGDIALQNDRTDLKIASRHANNTSTGIVTGIDGLLHGFGIHGNTITDSTIATNIKNLGLTRLTRCGD